MKIFITGGAGFIGSNAAKFFARKGHDVVVYDNLSRVGADKNIEWLRSQCQFDFVLGDIRDFEKIKDAIETSKADVVLHLAGQVAVTTSVVDPRSDFEINALGSFNVCEAIRVSTKQPILIFSSTNKVYGKMGGAKFVETNKRYELEGGTGVDELTPLQFYSPYGCSKGAADQYVLDYARIYGLRTVVFRQSCIYGTRQMGVEDQGWVAWFIIASALKKKISIYGNGKQVRDLLFVDDLLEAYLAAIDKIDSCLGEAFNVGGGLSNTLSLLELLDRLRDQYKDIDYSFATERPGDQEIFVCDLTKINKVLNWSPRISVQSGVSILMDWVDENLNLFRS